MKKLVDKNLILALILAAAGWLAVFFIVGPLEINDSIKLAEVMRWFEGKPCLFQCDFTADSYSVYPIFRPLAPLLAIPLGLIGGEETGLLILSFLFYLASVYLVFKITDLIYESKKQAFLASILWAFAISAIKYSVSAHATDVGAWFFCLLSVFLTLLYFKKRQNRWLVWNGLITGLGVLMKENGGLGVLFFAAMVFLSGEFNFREKFLKLIKFGIFFLMPVVFWDVCVSTFTSFSRFDFLSTDVATYAQGKPSLATFFILQHFLSLLTTFGLLGWLLIFFGGLEEWRIKNKERIKIILALVPFSLISWLWVSGDSRHAFIIGALGALLGSFGLINLEKLFPNKRIGQLLTILAVCLYITLNYSAFYLNDSLPFLDFYDIFYFFGGRF
ncbi:MAG: glycosyltransferase family 39 protein [bacterium]